MRVLMVTCALVLLGGCTRTPDYQEVHPERPMPPAGDAPVVLTVQSNMGQATFTRAQLESLRMVEYRTHRPDDEAHPRTYQGVLIADLMQHLKLQPKKLFMVATNDYSTFIEGKDVLDYPVMVAYQADGKPLKFEDKGPLLVVLPTHVYPEHFNTMEYGSKWVWYLKAIRVE